MLRVTAHNNAGFTVAEYEFATLTVNGGKLVWLSIKEHGETVDLLSLHYCFNVLSLLIEN
jgi:hypothetical protein